MRARAAFPTLLALAGCYDGFETEGGQLKLQPIDVVADPNNGLYPTNPLLEGTAVCVTLGCGTSAEHCPPSDVLPTCWTSSADGAGTVVDGCLVADVPGTTTWSFEPVACAAEGYAPPADDVAFSVVARSEVSGRLEQWVEPLVEATSTALDGRFPSDWTLPDGAPFRVVDTGYLLLPIALHHPDHEAAVAWNAADTTVEVVDTAGSGVTVSVPEPPWVRIEADAGSAADVVLHSGADAWTVASIVGVPESDAASLELVVAMGEDDDGNAAPGGARAIVRDADGNLLYGAPVTWEVKRADLAVSPGGELPGEDYAALDDVCLPPTRRAGDRRGTLRASLGDLETDIALAWTATAGVGPDDGFVPGENCPPPACGCATGGGGATGALALSGLLIGVRRRARGGRRALA